MQRWPALAAAQCRQVPRCPFNIQHEGHALPAGSVARAHLNALARWPEALRVDDAGVLLMVPPAGRSAFLAQANAQLREQGLIVAWRDETYPLRALQGGALLATLERAAARFWGTLTFGAHCNGYVADAAGRPQALWIARRSPHKATDPGLLDNLIGGGVPQGQTPAQTVLREGWEEAGLTPKQMRCIRPGRIAEVARDIPEGFMREHISIFDLALPEQVQPHNQDGEVQSLQRMSLAEALDCAASAEMTVDAALVTLDFALRHALLGAAEHAELARASAPLWQGPARAPDARDF